MVGLNQFSLDIYQATLPEDDNHFISPASISTAFGLVYGGARGSTADEIGHVLHYPFAPAAFAAANGELLGTMSLAATGRTLSVNNSLWVQEDFELLPAYVEQMEKYYSAGLQRVNYQSDPEAALKKINGWAEKKTNDRIKNLLSPSNITPSTTNILVNTIYLKSDWAEIFAKDETKDGPFTLANGERLEVPLMKLRASFQSYEMAGVQVIALPHRGYETEMLIFLPKSHNGLTGFEKSLTSAKLAEWIEALHQSPVQDMIVTLPKFKLETRSELSEALQEMGMEKSFSDDADFSAMANSPLKIDKVIHQTFLEVDEKGSEAAAATALSILVVSGARGPEAKPIIFSADHPFFFLIRDRRTAAIIFMGRLAKP